MEQHDNGVKKLPWTLVNAENVVPYECDEVYSSRQLTGDEMAGFPVININEGTLKAGGKPAAARMTTARSTTSSPAARRAACGLTTTA